MIAICVKLDAPRLRRKAPHGSLRSSSLDMRSCEKDGQCTIGIRGLNGTINSHMLESVENGRTY